MKRMTVDKYKKLNEEHDVRLCRRVILDPVRRVGCALGLVLVEEYGVDNEERARLSYPRPAMFGQLACWTGYDAVYLEYLERGFEFPGLIQWICSRWSRRARLGYHDGKELAKLL